MRTIPAVLASLALAALFLAGSSPVEAAKDPVAAANARLEKDAGKAAKRIVKTMSRSMRSRAVATAREMKSLAKALKTGRDIEQLSGVLSDPAAGKGFEPSPAQVQGIAQVTQRVFAEYFNGVMADVSAVKAEANNDPAIQALRDAGLASGCQGGGGPIDAFVAGATKAWNDSSATVFGGARRVQAEITANQFGWNFIDCGSPPFNGEGFGAEQAPLLSNPSTVATFGDSGSGMGAIVVQSGMPVSASASHADVVVGGPAGEVLFVIGTLQSTPVVQYHTAESTSFISSTVTSKLNVRFEDIAAQEHVASSPASLVMPPTPPSTGGPPDDGLAFSISANPDPVRAGSSVNFFVAVSNDSPATADLVIDIFDVVDGAERLIGTRTLQVGASSSGQVSVVTSYPSSSQSGNVRVRVRVAGVERASRVFEFET